jgi:putative thioredoxin
LAGAVDLSALKNRAVSGQAAGASAASAAGGAAGSAAGSFAGASDGTEGSIGSGLPSAEPSNFELASLVNELTTANLRSFMAISNSVPILVEFYTSRSEHSRELSIKLARLVRSAEGRIVLARADADSSPELVKAFEVQALPSVHVILKGQPVALFTSDQPEEAITEVLTKVMFAAGQNGITGTVRVTESPEAAASDEPPVSPKHVAGITALNAGDLALAEKEFAAVLADSPADVVAAEALAQIRLQIRLENVDFDAVLAGEPQTLDETLLKVDCVLATGELDVAFGLILDRFAVKFDEREALRQRLLELFTAVGPGEAVANARKKLTMLMY